MVMVIYVPSIDLPQNLLALLLDFMLRAQRHCFVRFQIELRGKTK